MQRLVRNAILGLALLALLASLCLLTSAQQVTNPGGAGSCVLPAGSNFKYTSGTTTSSISVQTLCTTGNCPAGLYAVDYYIYEDGGTGCTTVGSGAVKVQLTWTDDQGAKSAAVLTTANSTGGGPVVAGMSLTTTGNGWGYGRGAIYTNGSATIQISTTLAACTTPGSWTGYNLKAVIYQIGSGT